ncbi:MAG: MOSC domain-containing protein [Gammaproteobacteria bacterium]|nr:MOSC domain-containing protein [Gammaproteobacteria bacterium]NND35657.1 MOSC domain-containing protein [Gammaproteobacteria bacterium]
MQLVSVNVGTAESIGAGNRTTVSGIDKRPVGGPVYVSVNGLPGDAICEPDFHGGPDQAVYVYGADDYAWWSEQLGREVRPGTFGDNLTIAGLPRDLNAGDRLTIGAAVLEATAPRIPCSTLATQMGDTKFGLAFRRAERPGFYFRVIREGQVAAGDPVSFAENENGSVSMLDLFRLSYAIKPAAESLRRAIEAPIATRMRDEFIQKLAAVD